MMKRVVIMVEEGGRTCVFKRQIEYVFGGDFCAPVGTTTNSLFTHAVHGRVRILCSGLIRKNLSTTVPVVNTR